MASGLKGSSNHATSSAASICEVRKAHLKPCFQKASLPPASTISSDSGPIASRAARTIASSMALLRRPNGPQPILNARNPSRLSSAQPAGQGAGSCISREA